TAACDPPIQAPPRQNDAGASPNASILPAPLATEPPDLADAAAAGVVEDAGASVSDAGGPPPEPLRPATPIPAEAVVQRDLGGVTLDAVFRWRDVPAPPKTPEVSADGIREAQKLTGLTWKVDLTENGRMRAEITARAFPLPAHSEIRARS